MLPSLNGLRAISIALVIVSHAAIVGHWSHGLIQGDLGVRIFFVISGFLITHLLLSERVRAGSIDLRTFYLRRCLRILPVYYAFLLALSVFFHRDVTACEWASSLTFMKDFGCGHPWLDDHLWSLSIEEQFYLFWPIALVMLTRKALVSVAIAIMLIGPAARVAYYFAHDANRAYALLTNIDILMYGCLTAVAIDAWPGVEKLAERRVALTRFVAIAMIVIPQWLTYRLLLAPLNLPFGPSVQAAGAGLLIASVVYGRRGLLFAFLNRRLVSQLGVFSYSIYIWQQPFFSEHVPASVPTRVCMVLATAVASYYLLERPLLRLRHRLKSRLSTASAASA